MKLTKKLIAVCLVSAFGLGNLTNALASGLVDDIKAKLHHDIKMTLKGKTFTPKDENEKAIEPIIYEDKVYLPVKTVCDAVSVEYSWDEKEKTLNIGEDINVGQLPMDLNIIENLKHLYYTENSNMLKFNGKTYSRGVSITPDSGKYNELYFDTKKLAGKVSKIGGTLYVDESAENVDEVTVMFRKSKDENSEVLAIYQFKPGELFEFEFDTNGANIVVMEANNPSSYEDQRLLKKFALLNPYYKNKDSEDNSTQTSKESSKKVIESNKSGQLPMDLNIIENLKHLYYTENSNMLKFNGKTYSRGVSITPDSGKYNELYFDTKKLAGKVSKIGGTLYVDESAENVDEVTVMFRKSKDENSEVLAIYQFKPGELFEFEFDTNGANIVVMEANNPSSYEDQRLLKRFALLNPYYIK